MPRHPTEPQANVEGKRQPKPSKKILDVAAQDAQVLKRGRGRPRKDAVAHEACAVGGAIQVLSSVFICF